MQQIILNVEDDFAIGLAALEEKDGQTVDERFAKYVRDIEQNEMGIAPGLPPARKQARLAELAEDAQEAVQRRADEKEAAKKATQKAVAEASTEKTVDVSGL